MTDASKSSIEQVEQSHNSRQNFESNLLIELERAFTCLPSIGPVSARRLSFHLLKDKKRLDGKHLSHILAEAMERIQLCQTCRHFTEHQVCSICQDKKRQGHTLCVVENPATLMQMEKASLFKGRYFVLMGLLSPLEGIGEEDLKLSFFEQRLITEDIKEIILALSSTAEGEATSFYIQKIAHKHKVQVSRLAQGVPLGGDLEHIDPQTLEHAFSERTPLI